MSHVLKLSECIVLLILCRNIMTDLGNNWPELEVVWCLSLQLLPNVLIHLLIPDLTVLHFTCSGEECLPAVKTPLYTPVYDMVIQSTQHVNPKVRQMTKCTRVAPTTSLWRAGPAAPELKVLLLSSHVPMLGDSMSSFQGQHWDNLGD